MSRILTAIILTATMMTLTTSCHHFYMGKTPAEPFSPPFMVIGANDSLVPLKPGGIWYMLPQTRIEVIAHAKRTELVKGPYAAFASRYLGIENVINTQTVFWQLEDIELNTMPVPDPSQLYYVSMGSMDTLTIPLSMHLNFNSFGALTGSESTDDHYLVGRTFMSPPQPTYSSVFKHHAESNLFEMVDTVIERVVMDSITVETKVLRTKMVEKPLEQRAKETADLILKIREDRLRLLTGYQEIPYDPITIRYMVDELERIEKEYIELFTGITLQTIHSRSFFITPDRTDNCVPVPMMRFSSQNGLQPADGSRGELLYIQCCSGGVNSNRLQFHMLNLPDSITPVFQETGFVYRQPEWTRVSVFLGNKLQKDVGLQLPQFGSAQRLPWFVTRFVMDPETGAVIRILIP